MIDPNSPCEACGGSALGGCTFPPGIPMFADVFGAHYCPACIKRYQTLGDMAQAIRERRSAPQQAQVFKVGDMVQCIDIYGAVYHTGPVLDAYVSFGQEGVEVGGKVGSGKNGGWTIWAKDCRHVAAPAQPPGACPTSPGGDRETPLCKPEECDGGYTLRQRDGRCNGCLEHHKTPGGSAEPAHGDTAVPAPSGSGNFHSAQPPGPYLADFTAAVEAHLLPRLPKGWRCVTDAVSRIPLPTGGHVDVLSANHAFMCWVLDDRGAEVHKFERVGPQLRRLELDREAQRVANEVLSRLARPTSELERGRGK